MPAEPSSLPQVSQKSLSGNLPLPSAFCLSLLLIGTSQLGNFAEWVLQLFAVWIWPHSTHSWRERHKLHLHLGEQGEPLRNYHEKERMCSRQGTITHISLLGNSEKRLECVHNVFIKFFVLSPFQIPFKICLKQGSPSPNGTRKTVLSCLVLAWSQIWDILNMFITEMFEDRFNLVI